MIIDKIIEVFKDFFDGISCFFSKDLDRKVLRYFKKTDRKFIKKVNYEVKKFKITAYIYENELDGLAGQCLPNNAILINKRVLSMPKLLQEYYLLHELGHKETPKISKIIIGFFFLISIPIALCSFLFGVMTFFGLLLFLFGAIDIYFFITIIFSGILCLIPFIITQQINESYAEYFVVKNTSISFYQKANILRREIRLKEKETRIKKLGLARYYFWFVFGKVCYPKESWVIAWFTLLRKFKTND